MPIQDNITIYPYSKTIRYNVAGTATVYTVTEFYSWIMNIFDEPGYMTYQRPMKYNTPTSYTMLNGWFLDNGDGSNILQHLTGASIQSSGYGTISDPVLMLDLDATTDWIAGDKDKIIYETSNVGPLLAYKNDYPVADSARIWIRDTNSHGTIHNNDTVTTVTGTGAGTANGDSVSGDEIYTNIYTIASFPSDVSPQVYIFQNGERIAEWSAFTNWDRGSIDILIPVQLGGSLIDSGNVTVFVRETGDTYTYVVADLSSGARTPVATETAADEVNVTKGEWYLLYDASDTGSFTVDDIIQNTATNSGTPPSWYAEVTAVTEFTDTSTGILTLRALRGTIANNNPIYVGTVQEALANGTPGDTVFIAWTSGTAPTTLGQVMTGGTSTAKRLLRGVDATAKYAVLAVQHDHDIVAGALRNVYYKNFSSGEHVTGATDGDIILSANSTTIISGYSDVTVGHINGTVAAGTFTGTFQMGERVNWDAGASHGIIVKTDGSTSITLANVSNPDTINGDTINGEISSASCIASGNLVDANTVTYAFIQQSAYSYSIFIEAGTRYYAGRDLDDVYAYLQYITRDSSTHQMYTSTGSAIVMLDGQEYIKAISSYSATKTAPFGSLAGGVFFGAQGVWVQGMISADNNNIKLTDHSGILREPYVSVNVAVTNTRVDDDVTVYLESGSTGLPDKTQYTSHNTANVQSDSTFERDAVNFPIDTPSSGTFIVVDASANEEHRYRYASWATTVLTLPTERSGTADGSTSGQDLYDAGATYQTWLIQRGDIIRNITDSGWGYVTEVVSETHLRTTQLTTSGKDWAVSDTYEINSLVVTYNNNDKFFIPYIDTVEDTGTDLSPGDVTVSVLYTTTRAVVVRVRNVAAATPIQPFETTSDITSAGMTVSVIRTEDEVYT